MNPLFAVLVFVETICYALVSTPWSQQQNIARSHSVNFLSMITFVFLGWHFNGLTIFGVILFGFLWAAGYWASLLIPTNYFLAGRAILATLVSSTALYLINKISMLYHLQQGWAGYVVTFAYGIGEIVFLIILIYFTFDTVHAINLRLDPHKTHVNADCNYTPFVSIHLAICNEPAEVVSKTLLALAALSYPAYEVIVVDNNTNDAALWTPIKKLCEQLGFQFKHVNPHQGYKAGALNLALTMTSADAELIAVVDADYELIPEFLKDNVAGFLDPNVAFLQTAQRHNNVFSNVITREFNPVYDFFYDITLLARSQRNSIIFAGSAGIIRYSALSKVGKWAEWSITEDAELSLRLLAQGYKSIYVNRDYGSGLMPETFNDIRRQWFRYYFGGMDITMRHLRSTILARNQLSFTQRIDFTLGGVISLGAALMIASTVGMMITSITYSALQRYNPELSGEVFYLFTVFSDWLIVYNCYQVFRLFLLSLVFRLVYRSTWGDAFNAAISFQSLVTTQAKAAVQVLIRKKQSFVKTPKHNLQGDKKLSIKSILLEMILCGALGIAMLVLLFTVPSPGIVLGYLFLGLWQVLIYGSTIWRAIQST